MNELEECPEQPARASVSNATTQNLEKLHLCSDMIECFTSSKLLAGWSIACFPFTFLRIDHQRAAWRFGNVSELLTKIIASSSAEIARHSGVLDRIVASGAFRGNTMQRAG